MWKFHRVCGQHVSLDNNCTSAKRSNPNTNHYYGVCFTNTTLVTGKLYEIQVDNKLVTEWNLSLNLGVSTNMPPHLAEISGATELKDSWTLHGNLLYQNRIRIGVYPFNLDTVEVGDKIGIMKASDSTLHYYFNGIDQGIAFSNLPEVVYGVVDLSGNCWQVSISNQGCDSKNGTTENRAESATGAGAQVAIKKISNFSGRPTDWTVDAVCEFITSIPDCAPYAAKFRSEHIDGAALIELDKKDLKDFFKMPLGLAVKICSHLKKLEENK